MRPDVHVVKCDPVYPAFPYRRDTDTYRALERMWAARGEDPSNPFGRWLAPGGTAVIKPNWVMDVSPVAPTLDALITHASLVSYVLGWCAVAMDGRGTVILGDCPLQSCDFGRLRRDGGVDATVRDARERFPDLDVRVEDWRLTVLHRRGADEGGGGGAQISRTGDESSPTDGYLLVDLGRDSFLEEIAEFSDRFRVTCYDPRLMQQHHAPGKHEYLLSRRALDADLLINLPKLKTHKKAGLTGALKNLVGINGHKEYLPHHIRGSYFEGGDWGARSNRFMARYEAVADWYWGRYQRMGPIERRLLMRVLGALHRAAKATGADGITAGGWSGNETVWRMTLDINHAQYFGAARPRHVITLVDAIVAGEGDGPLAPTPRPLGLVLVGENPAYLDATGAKLMGYNLSRVPLVYHGIYHRRSRFAGPDLRDFVVQWVEGDVVRPVCFDQLPVTPFRKPKYWGRADAPRS
jgi:uncharacterized protein (DUF362 family)